MEEQRCDRSAIAYESETGGDAGRSKSGGSALWADRTGGRTWERKLGRPNTVRPLGPTDGQSEARRGARVHRRSERSSVENKTGDRRGTDVSDTGSRSSSRRHPAPVLQGVRAAVQRLLEGVFTIGMGETECRGGRHRRTA